MRKSISRVMCSSSIWPSDNPKLMAKLLALKDYPADIVPAIVAYATEKLEQKTQEKLSQFPEST